MKLKNKNALVTGGSSGIGKAIAELFALNGASVGIVASNTLEKAAEVSTGITDSGGQATPFVCDVSSVSEISSLVRSFHDQVGKIDILVNAAGVFYPTPLETTTEAEFDRMININLKGMYFACKAAAPDMIAAGSGKIINISSIAAYVVSRDYGLYAAVKSGVVTLTKALALQLAPHGINVNAIAPGNTETPINEDIRTSPEFAERRKTIAAQTPSQRLFSTPQDIAAIAMLLATEDGRAMHGSTILADEGRSAGM